MQSEVLGRVVCGDHWLCLLSRGRPVKSGTEYVYLLSSLN